MEEYDFMEENFNKSILDDIDELFNVFLEDDNIISYSLPLPYNPPIPISDICFPKDTLINTDQGKIMIENINIKIHTIHGKKIKAITKTISPHDYLVCFEKHSIHFNYPSRQTIMSKNHKILYNGEMMKAYTFLKNKTNIYKIKYNGDILYNVLMEDYSTIKVNNLICETLHPSSVVAKLYNKFDKKYISKLKQPKRSKKLYITF
jgi:hypothetical protein